MSASRKKSDRLAWFKMDAGAFLTVTNGLSSSHVGILSRLMCCYWTQGASIPSNEKVLKRQIGVTTEADEQAFREVMEEFFPSGQNEFLDTQMAETLAHSRMQSEKAALSHRKRTAATWDKEKQSLAAETHPADF